MKYLVLIGFLFLVASHSSYSQDKKIEITGEIINAETKEPVPYVHIVNDRQNQGTTSNSQGRFWITMEKQDTLLLSAIGFEKFAFTLKKDITTDKLVVTIEMNTATMELQPVKVFAFRDEAALKRALVETEVSLDEQQRGIQLPGFYYGPTKEVKPSAFGNPISFIASKFSRDVKEQKKLQQYQQSYDYQKLIKAKYNQAVVMELTGLPEEKVEEFMEFCKLEDSFLGPASEYEIAIAVNKCMVDFSQMTLSPDSTDN